MRWQRYVGGESEATALLELLKVDKSKDAKPSVPPSPFIGRKSLVPTFKALGELTKEQAKELHRWVKQQAETDLWYFATHISERWDAALRDKIGLLTEEARRSLASPRGTPEQKANLYKQVSRLASAEAAKAHQRHAGSGFQGMGGTEGSALEQSVAALRETARGADKVAGLILQWRPGVKSLQVLPSPFIGRKSLAWQVKAQSAAGQPCKRGQTAKHSGCTPKGKPAGKKPVKDKDKPKEDPEATAKKHKAGQVKKDIGHLQNKVKEILGSSASAKEKLKKIETIYEVIKDVQKANGMPLSEAGDNPELDDLYDEVFDSGTDDEMEAAADKVPEETKEEDDDFEMMDDEPEDDAEPEEPDTALYNMDDPLLQVGQPVKLGNAWHFKVPDHVLQQGKTDCEKLSPDQAKAIVEYSDTGYQKLNKSMRSCPPDFGCVGGSLKELMKNTEAAIAAAKPLKEPVRVFRGISGLPISVRNGILGEIEACLKAGKPYKMPCISSTTVSPEIAVDSFGGLPENMLVYQVKAKNGLYIDSISVNEGERELLQSANTRYKVVAMEDADYEGAKNSKRVKTIYLEEV